MTQSTKTKLEKINQQLALVEILEATTPNNFKAKLTALANLVNKPGNIVIDMKDYVDANGQAYISRLATEAIGDKDTAAKVKGILFGATTGVNAVESDKLVKAVQDEAKATPTVDADKLVKALNNLGLKQVATANKSLYAANTDFKTVADKDVAQVQVDTNNLEAVSAATTDAGILDKLSVFGLDNVIAANAAQYLTDKADIAAVIPDAGGDNAKTVALVKAEVAKSNKKVTLKKQLDTINEATTVAEVKTALDALANVGEAGGYLIVRSADREFIAAHILEERPVSGYTDVPAIVTEIGADDTTKALKAHKEALAAVNAITYTSSPATLVSALDKVLDEDFAALTAVQKSAKAQEFQDKLTFDTDGNLKTPFVTLSAVKALLK